MHSLFRSLYSNKDLSATEPQFSDLQRMLSDLRHHFDRVMLIFVKSVISATKSILFKTICRALLLLNTSRGFPKGVSIGHQCSNKFSASLWAVATHCMFPALLSSETQHPPPRLPIYLWFIFNFRGFFSDSLRSLRFTRFPCPWVIHPCTFVKMWSSDCRYGLLLFEFWMPIRLPVS